MKLKKIKRFSIGYRTLKTAVGIAVAIGIASFLDLEYYTSAGILTILSIQTTKRKSVHAIYTRVAAGLLSLLLSYILFSISRKVIYVAGRLYGKWCIHSKHAAPLMFYEVGGIDG